MDENVNAVTTRSQKKPLTQQDGSSTERFNEQHSDVETSLYKYSQAPLIKAPKEKATLGADVVSLPILENTQIPPIIINPPVSNSLPMLPTNIFQPRLVTIARQKKTSG